MIDYYKILEVDPQASPEVIEKAFKALSIKYHPDTNKTMDTNRAHEKWLEISKAYTILSDKQKREKYNAERKRAVVQLFLSEGLIGLARKYFR